MSSRGSRSEFLCSMQRCRRSAIRIAQQCTAGDAGFTLIEVLVAIAVLAVVLGAIGAVVGTTVKGVRSVERQLPLLETAQSLLASLPERGALRPGTQSGASGGFRWRIDVTSLAPQAADAAVTSLAHPASDTKVPVKWTPLAITVRVQSSDGPPVRLDTVRLVPRPGG